MRSKRQAFYPARPTLQQGWLPVGSLSNSTSQHRLYYEVSGNPDGIPVVYLHGGPGGSVHPNSRRFFCPATYKLIMFDQRGCGRSEPHCSLEDNTTQDLIEDIESLRTHLGIDKWLVFGGSWGSTLALAYAQSHVERVMGLVLRGLFLGRPKEVEWFLTGPRAIYPEVWQAFSDHVGEQAPEAILKAYLGRLKGPDFSLRLAAARAWSLYESSLVTLVPNPDMRTQAIEPDIAMPVATLEAHFFEHGMFMSPNQLLDNLDGIRHIPTVLVHGRYDVICPLSTAYDLAKAWPQMDMQIVADAGHASTEPGIASALIAALDAFASTYQAADNKDTLDGLAASKVFRKKPTREAAA